MRIAFVVLLALYGTTNAALIATTATLVDIPEKLPEVSLDVERARRFPSKEERVRLYMSNWYVPPCATYSDGLVRYEKHEEEEEEDVRAAQELHQWPTYKISEAPDVVAAGNTSNNSAFSITYLIESKVTPDKAFVLDRGTILDCSIRGEGDMKTYGDRIQFRSNMHMYCSDVARSLLPAMDHVAWEQQQASQEKQEQPDSSSGTLPPPMLLQFGDLAHSHVYRFIRLPHLKKFRIAASSEELQRVTDRECYDGPRDLLKEDAVLQPIVWKLATHRHYGLLGQVAVKDKSWEDKRNKAVFRGQLTGSLGGGYDKHVTAEQNCLNLIRCRLVYNLANSTLVNARLTNTRKRIPDVLNGVNLTTSSVTVRALLQYKGVVMLEGNDVASGLKWALLSNSVVLMPIPQHTSWAMEELLQPWVHYVPLNDEATDVEEKMQWILDHDEEARRISYASTLWMQDLVFHPDAAEDDAWIQEEIVRRYQRHFAPLKS